MNPTLTEQEQNAPGAQLLNNGGVQSALPPNFSPTISTPTTNLSFPTATPTVTPTPVVEPTIGDTLQGIKDQALGIQDTLNKRSQLGDVAYDSYPTYEELYPTINERDIQRNQMRLFQKEIDATNAVYNDLLNQERLIGQGRLGSQRAISARSGLLGSDFGAAQKEKVIGYNTAQERAVENERLAKIGSIMGTMRKAVADEIAAKRLARTQDANSYIEYLANASARKQNNATTAAQSILNAGLDINDLSQDELASIGKEAGLSANDIINAYGALQASQAEGEQASRKTEAEIAKIEADIAKGKLITIGEGTMLYDTETGETFKNPKTYAPGTGSGSSVNLTGEDKRTLLGGGWSESDIATIEADVKTNGLSAVIANAKENGASASQIASLQKAYGAGADNANQFLTKDYFKSLFGDEALKKAAKDAGFISGGGDFNPLNNSGDVDTYLTNLENTVNLYRQAGYTDQEILKMMQ